MLWLDALFPPKHFPFQKYSPFLDDKPKRWSTRNILVSFRGDNELETRPEFVSWSWGKAVPVQASTGPEGFKRLRFPDFKKIGKWRWQDCQSHAPTAFTPQEIFVLLISVRGWAEPRTIVRLEGFCPLIQGYSPLFSADIGQQLAHPTAYTKILSSWTLLDRMKKYILKPLLCNFALCNDTSFPPEIQCECFSPASCCAKRFSKFNLKFCGYMLLRWCAQCHV
jgi:hypothetical protein